MTTLATLLSTESERIVRRIILRRCPDDETEAPGRSGHRVRGANPGKPS
jgi:hypothetical protein